MQTFTASYQGQRLDGILLLKQKNQRKKNSTNQNAVYSCNCFGASTFGFGAVAPSVILSCYKDTWKKERKSCLVLSRYTQPEIIEILLF